MIATVGCVGGLDTLPSPPSTTTTPPGPVTTVTPIPPAATPATTRLAAPVGVDPDSPCLLRAGFGNPSASAYLLPSPTRRESCLSQSYCFSEGSHSNQLAYNFNTADGHEVKAARAGTVVEIKEGSPDNGLELGEHTYVMIRHDDGTVVFYAHLMEEGVEVGVGQRVEPGDASDRGPLLSARQRSCRSVPVACPTRRRRP